MSNIIEKTEVRNEVQVFNSEKFGDLRMVEIDNEPWFVGKDVAEALGYSNINKAIQVHVDDEDKKTLTYKGFSHFGNTLWSGNDYSNKILINESGMYTLIFGSKLPDAKSFKHWVTSEVLPTIRKTGGYVQQGREIEFMKNPNSAIFSAVQSLTMMAEALQMQLESTKAPLPVLSEKAIAIWKKNISAPLVNMIADRYGIEFGEAVQRIYERMTLDYGFDKGSVLAKFTETYGADQTEGKNCIDAVADNPEYQRYFVRASYRLMEKYREMERIRAEVAEKEQEAAYEELVEESTTTEPKNEIPYFKLADDYERTISTLAEFIGLNPNSNNTKLRKKIFDRMASSQAWKHSMTHYNCKTKKALIECSRTYRERFVNVCNAMVNESMEGDI